MTMLFEMDKFNELLKAYREACLKSVDDHDNDWREASAHVDLCEYLSECGINTGVQII